MATDIAPPTPLSPGLWTRWAVTSAVVLGAWIPCETLGGLAFLALGVRLWEYRIAPLFWQLTSLAGWGMVLAVAGTNCFLYLLWEHRARVRGRRRWLYRAAFLMVAGPVNEVAFNSLIWLLAGTPLYLYTVLPTFDGSGSYLSPLYYLTLLTGFWLEERIPGSLASRAAPVYRFARRKLTARVGVACNAVNNFGA